MNLAERKRILLVDNIALLREVVQKVKSTHPFHIDAIVVMPDHLHAIWTLTVKGNQARTDIKKADKPIAYPPSYA